MENSRNVKNYKIQYGLIGLLTGFIIISGIYYFALSSNNQIFTFENIFSLHKGAGYFYIIDSLPILLFIVGFFVGRITQNIAANLYTIKTKREVASKEMLDFAENLVQGHTDADYNPEKENNLGKILVDLRDSLEHNKKEELQRKQEDEQRNWTAEGLAKFGEILRQNNDNIEVLSYDLISNLCQYLKVVQGGLFLLNEEYEADKHFELIAHFAYNRRKYNKKRVDFSEGLIGRAAFEQNTIYIDEVPEDYVEVTSGLGEGNPKTLLIVPLKVNDKVHGVIELASFEYIEKYAIEFVEKVAESIATTISTVNINVKTASLLEESRETADRMTQQEEEMRQNMEELQATQEEAAKQAEEFISFTNSVNHTLIRAEYDVNGILLYANTKFLKKLGYTNNSEVEGAHISMFIADKDKPWFNEIWENLANGGNHFEGYMKHITKVGKDLWTISTYTCVRNQQNNVEKILFLAIDNTEYKEQSLDFEAQLKAIDQSNIKMDFAPSGRMLSCNDKFIETTGFTDEDLKNYSVFDFMGAEESSEFEEVWHRVMKGEPFKTITKVKTKDDQVRWFDVSYTAAHNMYNEVAKVISIAQDITEQKQMEMLTKEQNTTLKIQEEKLKASEVELQKRLEEAKKEVKQQFQEIEKVKIRNEKTLEGAHDAIFTINQSGTVEFFNRAAESLWGYPRKEVLGENVKKLFKPASKEEDEFVFTLLHPEQRKMVGIRKEISILKSDGESSPIIILLAGAKVQNEYTYTAFIQNIEVELF